MARHACRRFCRVAVLKANSREDRIRSAEYGETSLPCRDSSPLDNRPASATRTAARIPNDLQCRRVSLRFGAAMATITLPRIRECVNYDVD